jgi:hydroxymethylbilane synthase
MSPYIRLGSRQSPLALRQARIVSEQLQSCYPEATIEIIGIKTQGDIDKVSPLSEIGGKGVFTKSLEKALLGKTIDIAVHSLKDMTSYSPKELEIAGVLSPEAREDALIVKKQLMGATLKTLPKNASLGTSSLRRIALIKKIRPDLHLHPIRGNIETRIAKCETGEIDAIILSKAGLLRMGWQDKISETLDPTVFIPAPGQGVIALQIRRSDKHSKTKVNSIINHEQTKLSGIEYSMIHHLGLDCQYPFGAYAVQRDKKTMILRCCWGDTTGEHLKDETITFTENDSTPIENTVRRIKTDFDMWGVYD